MTLILATRNRHKIHEIRNILGAESRFFTLADFPGSPEVVEDAATFAGNATKKAVELACFISGTPMALTTPPPIYVLADDSGLEVDALGGAPGAALALTALGVNLVGDWLRDTLDPKLRI